MDGSRQHQEEPGGAHADPEEALAGFAGAVRDRGCLAPDALERARRVAERRGDRVDTVLAQLGLMSEDAIAATWAELLGIAHIPEERLTGVVPETGALRPGYLRAHRALPLARDDGTVQLILGDPLDRACLDAVGFALGQAPVPAVAAPSAILAAIERAAPAAPAGRAGSADPGGEDDLDIGRLRDLASDAPVVRWVTGLLDAAVAAGASDIHIDPDGAGLSVRLRVDGVLRPLEPPAVSIAAAVVSRLKILARLDIAERRLPQDGRAGATVRGRTIDLRVATAPTPAGETVVVRVLDGAGETASLDRLGFAAPALRRLQATAARPAGIVLVTGPTGAGKTTTLYALLRAMADPGAKVITVEDPVEYALPGITQIQANARIGLGFATVLRAILRHNPDRVMVGEIRDAETASMAVEAALTGHPVLSTLHTTSAVGAITRLREMGIAAYLLASALSGVVAQRLVRRLCPSCALPETAPDAVPPGTPPGAPRAQDCGWRRPVGCAQCRGDGHRGRTVVAEVLAVDAAIREGILAGAPEAELARLAARAGMQTLRDHALAKAAAGEIALADARAVAAED